jgi:hypothetical protein
MSIFDAGIVDSRSCLRLKIYVERGVVLPLDDCSEQRGEGLVLHPVLCTISER